MENYKMTSKDFFKSIQIVHLALMTGLIFLGIIAFYLHYIEIEMENGKEINFALIYVVPVFTITGIIAINALMLKQ